MPRINSFIRYWLPVLLWMGLIFTASTDLMSSTRTSRIMGPLLRWFHPDISDAAVVRVQLVVRKAAHVTEYALLTLLLWRAWRKPRSCDPRPWRWQDATVVFLIAVVYAAGDEFHQSLVPSREGALRDVLFDSLGVGLALGGIWGWGRWRKRW